MHETNFYCKPARGERIETKLQIPTDRTAAIHGVLLDLEGTAVSAALVLLFRVEEDGIHVPIAQTAPDSEGHFAFGGLEGDVLYRIKVFRQGGSVRALDVTTHL